MKVSKETTVDAKAQPFLAEWDSTARKYHTYFEVHRKVAQENLHHLKQNIFTKWRSPIQLHHRYA